MSVEEFQARVGSVLRDKWTLDRLIGIGGMAAVYAATHKIGRTDAIKLLAPAIAVSDELRARFEQEARAVNSIGHPGTVEIRDIDVTTDGTPFLVMELLEGETLAERIVRGKRVGHDILLALVAELLDVLAAAHAKGIIHRDIKPENLFIQKDGSLKVLDFGIARMRDGQVRTMAGTMIGTVAYMPPEQVKGLEIDHRVDLFAVGATMFRTIAGRPVHQDGNEWHLGTKMMTEPAPPLQSVAGHAPEWICRIVDRALAFQRDRRYPDAATMREDIEAVQQGREPPYASKLLKTGDDPREHDGSLTSGHTSIPAPADVPSEPPRPRRVGTKPMRLGLGEPAKEPAEADQPARDEPVRRELPTTKPEMPAFAPAGGELAPTDPQGPAFAREEPNEPPPPLEPTEPQAPLLPAGDHGADEPSEDAAADNAGAEAGDADQALAAQDEPGDVAGAAPADAQGGQHAAEPRSLEARSDSESVDQSLKPSSAVEIPVASEIAARGRRWLRWVGVLLLLAGAVGAYLHWRGIITLF